MDFIKPERSKSFKEPERTKTAPKIILIILAISSLPIYLRGFRIVSSKESEPVKNPRVEFLLHNRRGVEHFDFEAKVE